MNAAGGSRRTWIPALVVIAVVVPFAFSLLLYLQPGWFALGRTNHGHLIRPPVKITMTGVLPADFFHDHWTLVYIGDAHCDAACKETLYATRQIRLGLVTNTPPVQRLYIVRGRTDAASYIRDTQPDLRVVDATNTAGRRLAAEFTAVAGGAVIYVVDPNGLLMMSYPTDRDPTGLLEDMRSLFGMNMQ